MKRLVRTMGLVVVPFLMCFLAQPSFAHTAAEGTQNTAIHDTSREQVIWGLSAEEWKSYQAVMLGRRGTWSPGLDPITALGVSATTAAERSHYAELFVQAEFERTRNELAFQVAVDQAWKRLYPDVPRLGTAQSNLNGTVVPPMRYALIVSNSCEACEKTLNDRLAGMLSEAGEGVDIHVVGMAGDDAALRSWVEARPAILQAVQDGNATVNHGTEFEDLPKFPAIFSKQRNGEWVREL